MCSYYFKQNSEKRSNKILCRNAFGSRGEGGRRPRVRSSRRLGWFPATAPPALRLGTRPLSLPKHACQAVSLFLIMSCSHVHSWAGFRGGWEAHGALVQVCAGHSWEDTKPGGRCPGGCCPGLDHPGLLLALLADCSNPVWAAHCWCSLQNTFMYLAPLPNTPGLATQ